jgi:hypothetical protein
MQDAEYLNKADLSINYQFLCTVYMKEYAPVIYKFYPFVSTHTYVRNTNVCRRYPSYYRNVYDLINQKLYRVSNTTRDCRPSIF